MIPNETLENPIIYYFVDEPNEFPPFSHTNSSAIIGYFLYSRGI